MEKMRAVIANDRRRRRAVTQMMESGKVLTPRDSYNAALILHHGETTTDFKLAQNLALKALKAGEDKGLWLYAAATDRVLVSQGRRQKFGTQYYTHFGAGGRKSIKIRQYNKRTTDKCRAKFNVPSLRSLMSRERELTKVFYLKKAEMSGKAVVANN